jgi:glutaredoxin 3
LHLGWADKHCATMSARADVRIYVTSTCPYCHAAKRLLGKKQAAFTEIDVSSRPDLRSWLISASGQRTVPQIFINGKSVGGYSDVDALDRAGNLDPLLAELPQAGAPALPQ